VQGFCVEADGGLVFLNELVPCCSGSNPVTLMERHRSAAWMSAPNINSFLGPVTCAGEAFARDRLAFFERRLAVRSIRTVPGCPPSPTRLMAGLAFVNMYDFFCGRSSSNIYTSLAMTIAWPLQRMPTNFVPLAQVNARFKH
jgi:hypothetical protein